MIVKQFPHTIVWGAEETDHAVKRSNIFLGSLFEQTWQTLSPKCYIPRCSLKAFMVPEKKILSASLGEERANHSAFRTFVRFALVWFCRFPLPLGV